MQVVRHCDAGAAALERELRELRHAAEAQSPPCADSAAPPPPPPPPPPRGLKALRAQMPHARWVAPPERKVLPGSEMPRRTFLLGARLGAANYY